MTEINEAAGAKAWLAEAEQLVDEGVAELARRLADRGDAERAVRDRDL